MAGPAILIEDNISVIILPGREALSDGGRITATCDVGGLEWFRLLWLCF